MSKAEYLAQLIEALKSAFIEISIYLRESGNVSQALDSANTFGEQQLKADMYSNQILFRTLQGHCRIALSEEHPEPAPMNGEHFIVTFDPLDGSSIIDTNFSVGTIVGIWDCEELIGSTGRSLIYSMMVVYGSRTTLLLEDKTDLASAEFGRVCELTLVRNNWVVTKDNLRINPTSKLFAPANLRAQCKHEGYKRLVHYWADAGYTLRYTGGMVPDIYQIFLKGNGVFASPVTDTAPAKLRLLYECAPMARLVEAAGGQAYGTSGPVLDIPVEGYEHKTGMCVGSTEEVQRFIEHFS